LQETRLNFLVFCLRRGYTLALLWTGDRSKGSILWAIAQGAVAKPIAIRGSSKANRTEHSAVRRSRFASVAKPIAIIISKLKHIFIAQSLIRVVDLAVDTQQLTVNGLHDKAMQLLCGTYQQLGFMVYKKNC